MVFLGLTLLGATGAFVVREPYTDNRRGFGALVATVWVAAAFIVGGLLLWERALSACSGPVPTAEETYLGLSAPTLSRLEPMRSALVIGG